MLVVWDAVTLTAEFVRLLECKDYAPGQLLSPVSIGVQLGGPAGVARMEVKKTINSSPPERLPDWKWDPSYQHLLSKYTLVFLFSERCHGGWGGIRNGQTPLQTRELRLSQSPCSIPRLACAQTPDP